MEWIKLIFGSIGVLGMIVICVFLCIVLWLLGVATVFILKWGTIVSVLLIGASCIFKNESKK